HKLSISLRVIWETTCVFPQRGRPDLLARPDFSFGRPVTLMIQTPYYLIDKTKLKRNMEKVAYVREKSGAKALLALKCFATWSVFDLMSEYMDGTTSSSLNEVRLGHERFGGE